MSSVNNINNIPILAQAPRSQVEQLPTSLQRNIVSFLPFTETASRVHLTCKDWKNITPNGGHLNLSHTPITDDDLAHIIGYYIEKNEKISSLELSGCYNLTDTSLAHLRTLGLTSLGLSFTAISDEGLRYLSTLPLKTLVLGANPYITGYGLAYLKALPLTHLVLADLNIRDHHLAHLRALPLTALSLFCCKEITDEGLKHLSTLALTALGLQGTNITDAGLVHISDLPLEHLKLPIRITDAGLAHIGNLPLTNLNLRLTRVTDAGLANLSALPLKHLDLSLTEITDAGLGLLVDLPLETLDLSDTQITDEGWLHLVNLPQVEINLESTLVSDQIKGVYLLCNHLSTSVKSLESGFTTSQVETVQKIAYLILGYEYEMPEADLAETNNGDFDQGNIDFDEIVGDNTESNLFSTVQNILGKSMHDIES